LPAALRPFLLIEAAMNVGETLHPQQTSSHKALRRHHPQKLEYLWNETDNEEKQLSEVNT